MPRNYLLIDIYQNHNYDFIHDYIGVPLIEIKPSKAYNNKVKESAKQSLIAAQKITELVPNSESLEEVSSQISKTIEDAIKEKINLKKKFMKILSLH